MVTIIYVAAVRVSKTKFNFNKNVRTYKRLNIKIFMEQVFYNEFRHFKVFPSISAFTEFIKLVRVAIEKRL